LLSDKYKTHKYSWLKDVNLFVYSGSYTNKHSNKLTAVK